jgi:hypothetical protein
MIPVVVDITAFPNDQVAPGVFQAELEAAGLAPICVDSATAVANGVASGTVTTFFALPLTPGQQNTFDAVVAAHQGVAPDVTLEVSGVINGQAVTASGVPYVSAT